ncbi:MAG: hypothetical protein ACQESO_09820 [Bacillota bacterium]
MIEKRRGYYLGTEIDQKWWRRYIKDGFFARGTGEYWFDKTAFYFHRHLTGGPIVIEFKDIIGVRIGKWHSGKWAGGKPVVKLLWEKDSEQLCSGFVLSTDQGETEALLEKIKMLSIN